MSAMPPPLTPAQALCLQAVTFWVRAVRARKGDIGLIDDDGVAWSSITAEQCAAFIHERMLCDLSPKTCQNALKRLEQIGLLVRQKKFLSGWKHTYHYSLPEGREVVFVLNGGSETNPNKGTKPTPSNNPSTNPSKGSMALKSHKTLSASKEKDVVI